MAPQEGGAAKGLWRFEHAGGADEVRLGRVERYFCGVGTMSRLVEVNALQVARGDCECSCLQIERMNASLAAAGCKPAKVNLRAVVSGNGITRCRS